MASDVEDEEIKRRVHSSVTSACSRSLSAGSFGVGASFTVQHLHAEIADLAQAQAGKFRHARRPSLEDILDRVDAVRAGDGLDEVAQNFPIVARLSPGGVTARLSRWSRPLPLIIEPRFSAKPQAGSSAVA